MERKSTYWYFLLRIFLLFVLIVVGKTVKNEIRPSFATKVPVVDSSRYGTFYLPVDLVETNYSQSPAPRAAYRQR